MEVQDLPAYVIDLQTVYGDSSQTISSGSAVYFQVFTNTEVEQVSTSLESAAMSYFRQYVDTMWDHEQDDGSICPGEEVWGASIIYQRPKDPQDDDALENLGIVDALNQLIDHPGLFGTIAGVLDFLQEDPHHEEVMYQAFDDPSVALLHCYQVGDSGAFDGLLVAACRINGEAVFWIFLHD